MAASHLFNCKENIVLETCFLRKSCETVFCTVLALKKAFKREQMRMSLIIGSRKIAAKWFPAIGLGTLPGQSPGFKIGWFGWKGEVF